MNELFNRIIAWRKKNLPADLPYEPLPQIGFLIEELHEINREFIKDDIDAAVGEITDLIVFSVNAMSIIEYGDCIFDYGIFPKRKFNEKQYIVRYILRLINNVSSYALMQDRLEGAKKSLANNYFSLIEGCCECIESLGYSAELAMLETVKKIESRRGAWNSETRKWEKEKNQTDVYVPDYSKAKI